MTDGKGRHELVTLVHFASDFAGQGYKPRPTDTFPGHEPEGTVHIETCLDSKYWDLRS